ncbi:hypothetical protein MXL82_02310 [Staphylococcus gallinarum]|uniref:hypothetical protein n=1 Tax=Staphylococcus TaxID=1279 RepID=UPI001304FB7D|nr:MULTISPECIES: hypothetical protein [Staphylococcus]MEB6241876.1 hypothetical protein [Staphylococcus gallinarum]MEB6295053.1 hypothetical protein [Staphylococcus gallinarum]
MKEEQNKRRRQLTLQEKWKTDGEIIQKEKQYTYEQMKQAEKDFISYFKNKRKKDN